MEDKKITKKFFNMVKGIAASSDMTSATEKISMDSAQEAFAMGDLAGNMYFYTRFLVALTMRCDTPDEMMDKANGVIPIDIIGGASNCLLLDYVIAYAKALSREDDIEMIYRKNFIRETRMSDFVAADSATMDVYIRAAVACNANVIEDIVSANRKGLIKIWNSQREDMAFDAATDVRLRGIVEGIDSSVNNEDDISGLTSMYGMMFLLATAGVIPPSVIGRMNEACESAILFASPGLDDESSSAAQYVVPEMIRNRNNVMEGNVDFDIDSMLLSHMMWPYVPCTIHI